MMLANADYQSISFILEGENSHEIFEYLDNEMDKENE